LPLKWSYDDILNGHKLLDNNIKFQFINVFNQKSIIKLDLVLENNNKFIEFSENYYFDLKNNKSYQQKTNDETITSLKSDIRYYNHTKNNKLNILFSLFRLWFLISIRCFLCFLRGRAIYLQSFETEGTGAVTVVAFFNLIPSK
jgi:hypothetical protein